MFQVFSHAEAAIETLILEYDAYVATHFEGLLDYVKAENASRTGIRVQEGGEDSEESRLSSAVGTKQAVDLARRHLKIDAVEGLTLLIVKADALTDEGRFGF